MFSLELPHRDNSNEDTQYTINHPKSAAIGFFSYGATNEVETALVNEASVFEPLRVYCVLVLNVVC